MEVYFSAYTYHSDTNGAISFKVTSNQNNKKFRVKPISQNAPLQIYDSEKDLWISSSQPWAELPKLSPDVLINTSQVASFPITLTFVLQDIQSGDVFTSQAITVVNHAHFIRQLTALNSTVQHYNTSFSEDPVMPDSTISIKPLYLLVLALIFLVVVNGKLRKMLLYLHALVKKMVAGNSDLPFYICFLLIAGGYSFQ